MTEHEWETCTVLERMLGNVHGRLSRRKLRLFACACARLVWHLLDERARAAVEVAEDYADGKATPAQLHYAAEALDALRRADLPRGGARLALLAACHACHRAYDSPVDNATRAAHDAAAACREITVEDLRTLLREVAGNPFREAPVIRPEWLTWNGGTIPKMTRLIYDERRFQDMPILADALEEAGCTHAEILSHLRGPGPHVRGCDVLDLLLGTDQGAALAGFGEKSQSRTTRRPLSLRVADD
jgi:hypothetical protein